MKFILIALVFAVALCGAFAQRTRESVLARAEALAARERAELERLRTVTGSEARVADIQREERAVALLETEIRNAEVSGVAGEARLKALEDELVLAEDRLKRLEGGVFRRDLKTDLLTKAAELLTKSGGIVQLLESQGKPLLAEGVKAIETFVKDIETKLENSHPSSEIGKLAVEGLELLLKEAETKLEDEAKKLGITFVKRDLKTDLLAKAVELLTKSGGIVATLEKEGKPLLAEGFKAVETFVKDIETKLENSNPSSEIGKLAIEGLELLLKQAETKLEEEEKKLVGALL